MFRSSPAPRRGRALPANTRRPYSGALRRLDAWLGRPRGLEDATLAAYLTELHDQGESPGIAGIAARSVDSSRGASSFRPEE